MVTVVRVARIALMLVLTVIAISLVIGVFRPETGGLEKAVLAGMFAGCVIAGWAISSAAARLQSRAQRR